MDPWEILRDRDYIDGEIEKLKPFLERNGNTFEGHYRAQLSLIDIQYHIMLAYRNVLTERLQLETQKK